MIQDRSIKQRNSTVFSCNKMKTDMVLYLFGVSFVTTVGLPLGQGRHFQQPHSPGALRIINQTLVKHQSKEELKLTTMSTKGYAIKSNTEPLQFQTTFGPRSGSTAFTWPMSRPSPHGHSISTKWKSSSGGTRSIDTTASATKLKHILSKVNESLLSGPDFEKEIDQVFDCSDDSVWNDQEVNKTDVKSQSLCHGPQDSLKCFQDPIFCEMYHFSGTRELQWPVYGEYSYLPHSDWVRVIQHGGVAFLYHPCADNNSVDELKMLAESCLRRYVITPYDKLQQDKPLALVTWGCYLLMSEVNFTVGKTWIKSHAFRAPASHIHEDGQIQKKLVKKAKVLTDIKDSLLCPTEDEKAQLKPTPPPKKTHKHVGEALIEARLQKFKKKKGVYHRPLNVTVTKVNKSNAAWAVCSLLFLSGLLIGLLMYTKPWKPKGHHERFVYQRLYDSDDLEISYENTNFSLLKSGQDFFRKFRSNKKERTLDSFSQMKLLAPITEEEEYLEKLE